MLWQLSRMNRLCHRVWTTYTRNIRNNELMKYRCHVIKELVERCNTNYTVIDFNDVQNSTLYNRALAGPKGVDACRPTHVSPGIPSCISAWFRRSRPQYLHRYRCLYAVTCYYFRLCLLRGAIQPRSIHTRRPRSVLQSLVSPRFHAAGLQQRNTVRHSFVTCNFSSGCSRWWTRPPGLCSLRQRSTTSLHSCVICTGGTLRGGSSSSALSSCTNAGMKQHRPVLPSDVVYDRRS